MKFKLILLICLFAAPLFSQKVANTSYLTSSGERALQLEFTIPANQTKVWELFTKDEQLKRWIAPLAHIELRTGGYIITNYDEKGDLSDTLSSIRLPIINYIPECLLTLKVILNNNFSPSVISQSQHLQEIIQLIPSGKNQTKIISTMVGFGAGPDWDKAYDFFVRGNVWTYEQLVSMYK